MEGLAPRSGRSAESAAARPTASGTPVYSEGFAEPILWGTRMGFTLDEIATGLGIDRRLVIDVIESFTAIRFPVAMKARRLSRQKTYYVDMTRRDPAYLAWAYAQRGAAETLEAMAG